MMTMMMIMFALHVDDDVLVIMMMAWISSYVVRCRQVCNMQEEEEECER